ncbi:polyamine aminopropyltransferase [Desertihabitans aurantiacus]|uniref:polyamine aminopropyltransferase n=1 Tax=Desertihabitans aurantiacus TaxID=2282477 RepID=UPI0018E59BA1|nr:polyamine aminopropyltransferase [Desertihabitans aurantiacus]
MTSTPAAVAGRGGRRRAELDRPTVFAAALLVAVGGIVYELILGTTASYLFGNSVVAFSLATGLTLFGMGLGSLLASRLTADPGLNFARNEVLLALAGGSSVLLIHWAFAATDVYWVVFVVLSLAVGIGIGVEIPLLVSVVRSSGRDESVDLLSKVLALDYFGALVASLLFPFLLLPVLGLARTAAAVAVLNVGVALFMLWRMGVRTRWNLVGLLALLLLLALFAASSSLERAAVARQYPDPVVHQETTRYQRLVVTAYGADVRLWLNDQLQFSTVDEARYHETLAHAAMTSHPDPRTVVVLGGGDGMLAREVLRHPGVERVTVVDLDPAVTRLAREHRLLVQANDGALTDPRVEVVSTDAFGWLDEPGPAADVVLADLVDPADDRVAKLYSREMYQRVADRLAPDGVFATQATSSFFTPTAHRQVAATVAAGMPGRTVVPLSVNVPTFGEWGFALAVPGGPGGVLVEPEPGSVPGLLEASPLPPGLRHHDADTLWTSTRLAPAADGRPVAEGWDVAPSTLLTPRVLAAYDGDMRRWRY